MSGPTTRSQRLADEADSSENNFDIADAPAPPATSSPPLGATDLGGTDQTSSRSDPSRAAEHKGRQSLPLRTGDGASSLLEDRMVDVESRLVAVEQLVQSVNSKLAQLLQRLPAVAPSHEPNVSPQLAPMVPVQHEPADNTAAVLAADRVLKITAAAVAKQNWPQPPPVSLRHSREALIKYLEAVHKVMQQHAGADVQRALLHTAVVKLSTAGAAAPLLKLPDSQFDQLYAAPAWVTSALEMMQAAPTLPVGVSLFAPLTAATTLGEWRVANAVRLVADVDGAHASAFLIEHLRLPAQEAQLQAAHINGASRAAVDAVLAMPGADMLPLAKPQRHERKQHYVGGLAAAGGAAAIPLSFLVSTPARLLHAIADSGASGTLASREAAAVLEQHGARRSTAPAGFTAAGGTQIQADEHVVFELKCAGHCVPVIAHIVDGLGCDVLLGTDALAAPGAKFNLDPADPFVQFSLGARARAAVTAAQWQALRAAAASDVSLVVDATAPAPNTAPRRALCSAPPVANDAPRVNCLTIRFSAETAVDLFVNGDPRVLDHAVIHDLAATALFDSTAFVGALDRTSPDDAGAGSHAPDAAAETDKPFATALDALADRLSHLPAALRHAVVQMIKDLKLRLVSKRAQHSDPIGTARNPHTGKPVLHSIRVRRGVDLASVRARPRFYSPAQQAALNAELDRLARSPSSLPAVEDVDFCSAYASSSPVVVAKRDADQRIVGQRVVVDFRALNDKLEADPYPMPDLWECLHKLAGYNRFVVLDISSFFPHFLLDGESRPLTATLWARHVYKQWCRAPFGLRNILATAQRFIDEYVAALDPAIAAFVDDIARGLDDNDERALDQLRVLLQRLAALDLAVNVDKSQFFVDCAVLLGHEVTSRGVAPLRSRLKILAEWPVPATRPALKTYLAKANFFRRNIPHFDMMAAPLRRLLSAPGSLAPAMEPGAPGYVAFRALRSLVSSSLCTGRYDPNVPVHVYTDASGDALGWVIIQQPVGGNPYMLVAGGRKLHSYEVKYTTAEKELTAAGCAFDRFPEFTVATRHPTTIWFTDCQAISGALKGHGGNATSWRRCLRDLLGAFQAERVVARHVRGTNNPIADAISRVVASMPAEVYTLTPSLTPDASLASDDSAADVAVPSPRKESSAPLAAAAAKETRALRTAASADEERARVEPAVAAAALSDGEYDVEETLLDDSSISAVAHDALADLEATAQANPDLARAWAGRCRKYAQLQRADRSLRPYFAHATRQTSSSRAVSAARPSTDTYGRLYVKLTDGRPRLVVPKDLVNAVLISHHDGYGGGHLKAATLSRIAKVYWWPTMHADVAAHIKDCHVCQQLAAPRRNASDGAHPIMPRFAHLYVDWLHMERDAAGFKVALVMIDATSGAVEVVPVKDRSARTVIDVINTHWVYRYGPPVLLSCDAAAEFTGAELSAWAATSNIQLRPHLPYNKQANGVVERFVRTFHAIVIALCNNQPAEWRRHLAGARFAYMSAVSKPRSASPFKLLHGAEARTPEQLRSLAPAPEAAFADVSELKAFVERETGAAEATARASRESARKKPAVAAQPPLKVGDVVWVEDVDGVEQTSASAQRRIRRGGPFIISALLPRRQAARVVHFSTRRGEQHFPLRRLRLARAADVVKAAPPGELGVTEYGGRYDVSAMPASSMPKKRTDGTFAAVKAARAAAALAIDKGREAHVDLRAPVALVDECYETTAGHVLLVTTGGGVLAMVPAVRHKAWLRSEHGRARAARRRSCATRNAASSVDSGGM